MKSTADGSQGRSGARDGTPQGQSRQRSRVNSTWTRMSLRPRAPDTSAAVEHGLNTPGRPLDHDTRAVAEQRFGHDFKDVRVHTDDRAAAAADAVDARAYTVGSDVVFGDREYDPGSARGQRLVAHELAHVVQQRGGAPTRAWRDRADKDKDKGRKGPSGEVSDDHFKSAYTLSVEPGFQLEQRPGSVALIKYERTVQIRTPGGDEAFLRVWASSDLDPPFDKKKSDFAQLSAPGFSVLRWDIRLKYSKATGGSLNFWHYPDRGRRAQAGAEEHTSLVDLTRAQAPDFAQFFLSRDAQYKTLEDYIRRTAAVEVPEYQRELEEERRRIEAEKKKRKRKAGRVQDDPPPRVVIEPDPPTAPAPKKPQREPDPDTITDEEFEQLTPDQKSDLAWRAFKEEFNPSNIARNLAIGFAIGLFAIFAIIAAALGAKVLAAVLVVATIAAAVYGLVMLLKDTAKRLVDRLRHSEWLEAALTVLGGLAQIGVIVAGVLLTVGAVFGAIVSAPFLIGGMLVLGAVAIGAQIYLAYRDYQRAKEAKRLADFRRAIEQAARSAEGAIVDTVGVIISGIVGRVSKWVTGRSQKAPASPAPATKPPSPPLPPLKPQPVPDPPPLPAPKPAPAPKPPTPPTPAPEPPTPTAPQPVPAPEPPAPPAPKTPKGKTPKVKTPKVPKPPKAPKPPKTPKPPKARKGDAQQGVRDAIDRTNDNIKDSKNWIQEQSKARTAAGKNVATLRDQLLNMDRNDPARPEVMKQYQSAQKTLAELNARYDAEGERLDHLFKTRTRLQNALNRKTYDRPKFTPAQRATVWEANKENGKVLSPSKREIPEGSKNWVMGHKEGYEFWKHVESAASRGLTREQFLRECEVLNQYRPELPEDNATHFFEDKTSKYLGPPRP